MDKKIHELLNSKVEEKGVGNVARDLGVSHSTVSLVLKGTYAASTANIERKVLRIYGDPGGVKCPELGRIEPGICADNHQTARKLGFSGSNPDTLRLRHACLNCDLKGA